MSHRHITASASYQDGDSLVSATPATDDPVCEYSLPNPVEGERRIEFFNTITGAEFPFSIDGNGNSIDSFDGTAPGVVLAAGHGCVLRWIPAVGKWAMTSNS